MLRRRIFSGAMASVMALSSVAVVASAEETQYKTKADLEKLVNETYGDAWRTDKLSEYGTVSAEAVMDALEAADVILYDDEADEEDYTVAYKMVEATVAHLVIYTAEELQALIDDCKSIYESENIYNEELQDLIYTEDSFKNFVDAYDEACSFVSSTSSVDITACYEVLAQKKAELSKKAIVSKSMFRSVLKNYETIISAEFAYEDWRRGNIGWADINSGMMWVIQAGTSTAAYGTMYDMALACEAQIRDAYASIDAIKNLSKTSDDEIIEGYKLAQDAVTIFKAWTVDTTSRTTKSGVNALLKQYHNVLVADFATTTANTWFDAIKAVDGGVKSAGIWTNANDVGWVAGYNYAGDNKMSAANWNITPSKTIYLAIDSNGVCQDTATIQQTDNKPDSDKLPEWASKWQKLTANKTYDLLQYVPVAAELVVAANGSETQPWGNPTAAVNVALDSVTEVPAQVDWADYLPGDAEATIRAYAEDGNARVNLELAYSLAIEYLAATNADEFAATDFDKIDTTGIVAEGSTAKGNSKEWALVYRYLKYALSDRYDATVTSESYTRADVKALIEKAYDLGDLTGDAAIFEEAHMALVDARQEALEWVKLANADKTYKDYSSAYDVDDDGAVATWNSTQAYIALNNTYTALDNAYNAMKYSFGDIYEQIAEVSEKIDDGDLAGTPELLAALEDVAYALSTVSDTINTSVDPEYDENPGFNIDREFMMNNRVITNSGDPVLISSTVGTVTTKDGANPTHAALVAAVDALNAAIKAQEAPAVLLGDVDGNGSVNALDAAALLTAIVDGKTLDLAVADYDKSGAVNALDAAAILNAIVNG